MDWSSKAVLVTGGCSFIGSHLVDALVERGARIRVVDDLSSGVRENIDEAMQSGRVEFERADLLDPRTAASAVSGMDVVFHLAAPTAGADSSAPTRRRARPIWRSTPSSFAKRNAQASTNLPSPLRAASTRRACRATQGDSLPHGRHGEAALRGR